MGMHQEWSWEGDTGSTYPRLRTFVRPVVLIFGLNPLSPLLIDQRKEHTDLCRTQREKLSRVG